MYCTKCGNKNEEDALFCFMCGVPLKRADVEHKVSKAEDVMQEIQKKKSIPVFLWIGITSVIVLAAIIIVTVIVRGSDKDHYSEKMDLGRKYLSELNYEQAGLAFEEAIRIDPKKKGCLY